MYGYQPIKIVYKLAGGLSDQMLVGLAREYRITLHLPCEKKQSEITYFISPQISKSRKLSEFEANKLIKRVRALVPMIPPDDGMIEMVTDTPSEQLVIKSKGFKFDVTIDGSFYMAPPSVDRLIRLIYEIEPIDFEGLGVKPRGLL